MSPSVSAINCFRHKPRIPPTFAGNATLACVGPYKGLGKDTVHFASASPAADFPGKALGLAYELKTAPSAQDISDMFDLINDVDRDTPGNIPLPPPGPRRNLLIEETLEKKQRLAVLIRDSQGHLVGSGLIEETNARRKTGRITSVYVDKQYQGKKLGRWIMVQLLAYADGEAGFKRTRLAVSNPIARKLYKSLGFRRTLFNDNFDSRFISMKRKAPRQNHA